MLLADLPLILMLPALVVASALCSGSETAVFGMSHAERVRLRQRSPGSAAALAWLLEKPRRPLITILLLNMVANGGYFVVSSVLALRSESVGVRVAVSAASLIAIVLIGEILAKLVAAAHRATWCVVAARPLVLVVRALGPVVGFIDGWLVAPLSRLALPGKRRAERGRLSAEELEALIDHSARRGVIDPGEQQLLADVLGLGERRVREVMVPRQDVRWVDADAAPDEVRAAVEETGHTTLPVARGSLDDGVIGMLDVKRYLFTCERAGSATVASHLRPALFVPENARLDRLLERFREAESSVAVCVDEYGGVSGLVSIEDVVEELVSHQPDAEGEPESEVRSLGSGRWLVPGRLGVREWAELLGVETALLGAHPRVATVAGLLIARLGRIPAVGDEVSIGNVRLRAESARDRVVDTVLVTLEGSAA